MIMKPLAIILVMCVVLCACKKPDQAISSFSDDSDTTSHNILWKTDTLGYYFDHLNAVWASSPTSVWAVGIIGPPNQSVRLVVHYNGVSWNPLQDDSLSRWISAGILTGVHGISDSCVFVVGAFMDYKNGQWSSRGVAAKWNGHRWINISPPETPHHLLSVKALAPNNVYVTGDSGDVAHYDGARWTHLPRVTALPVWSSALLPNGEVHAAACEYFNSPSGSTVMRLDAHNVTDEGFIAGRRMFGIWGTSNNLYVAGEGIYSKSSNAIWTWLTVPYHNVTLDAIDGSSGNDIIVCGSFGAVLHWSGSSWKFYDDLFDMSSSKSYFGAAAVGGNYFLVGYSGSRALVTIGRTVRE